MGINNWFDEIIDRFAFEPLDDMTKGIITQTITEGLPLRYPGNYEVEISWCESDLPAITIKFADKGEELIWRLKYL